MWPAPRKIVLDLSPYHAHCVDVVVMEEENDSIRQHETITDELIIQEAIGFYRENRFNYYDQIEQIEKLERQVAKLEDLIKNIKYVNHEINKHVQI